MGAWTFCRNLFIYYSLPLHFLESGFFQILLSHPLTFTFLSEVFLQRTCPGLCLHVQSSRRMRLLLLFSSSWLQLFICILQKEQPHSPKPLRHMYIVTDQTLPRNHIKKKLINLHSLCSHPIPVTKISKLLFMLPVQSLYLSKRIQLYMHK